MGKNDDEIEKSDDNADLNLDQLKDVGSIKWKKYLKVFNLKIPLWLLAIVVIGSGGWFGFSKLTQDKPLSLKPAVTDAQKVDIVISTCDEQIDSRNINIREEELRIADQLENSENVKQARVRIERDDELCEDQEQKSDSESDK